VKKKNWPRGWIRKKEEKESEEERYGNRRGKRKETGGWERVIESKFLGGVRGSTTGKEHSTTSEKTYPRLVGCKKK